MSAHRATVGSMTTVQHLRREDVESRRNAILRDLGVSAEELAERAAAGGLVGEEWVAWAEVEELGYLLDD